MYRTAPLFTLPGSGFRFGLFEINGTLVGTFGVKEDAEEAAAAMNLVEGLIELGFGEPDTSIKGADVIDLVNDRLDFDGNELDGYRYRSK